MSLNVIAVLENYVNNLSNMISPKNDNLLLIINNTIQTNCIIKGYIALLVNTNSRCLL